MDKRPNLQTLLENILGSRNVYFQPPPSVQIRYPAIVYSRSLISTRYANGMPYTHDVRYEITIIDSDPESEIIKQIQDLPKCKYERDYVSNNLNYTVFTIYY